MAHGKNMQPPPNPYKFIGFGEGCRSWCQGGACKGPRIDPGHDPRSRRCWAASRPSWRPFCYKALGARHFRLQNRFKLILPPPLSSPSYSPPPSRGTGDWVGETSWMLEVRTGIRHVGGRGLGLPDPRGRPDPKNLPCPGPERGCFLFVFEMTRSETQGEL